ncbi:MAG: tryptophan-rich sensory protein [Oscillospiraceae bacterium]|nr:tryptophan-rich sensory protein [Oscillospiraceae bacterium]
MKDRAIQNRRPIPLIIAIVIPLLAGVFSACLTAEDMTVYETMNRPLLAPPDWVFPIAWTILYVLMGLASYFVYTSEAAPEQKRKALSVYAAQLFMNLFWSILFFTYARFLLALIWLLVMWVFVLICVIRFYRIRRSAGIIMGALFLWTTFAAYLNLAIYVMSITPAPLTA